MKEKSTPVDQKDTQELKRALAMIEVLQKAMDKSATLEQVRMFLILCMHEGLTGVDYEPLMDSPQSSISRNLLNLGDYTRTKAPGWKLVEAKIEAADLRARRYRLSAKGRHVLSRLERALES